MLDSTRRTHAIEQANALKEKRGAANALQIAIVRRNAAATAAGREYWRFVCAVLLRQMEKEED